MEDKNLATTNNATALLADPKIRGEILNELRKAEMFALLGNGECFFIQEAGTKKRGFKVKVPLTFPHHFVYPGNAETRPMIIAEGYDKANQYCGIEVIDVNKGKDPYERDSSGRIVGINLHRVGVGYSPTGNLVAVDQTYHADTSTLLIQEIQAKLKKFPFLGCLGQKDQKPTEILYYDCEWKAAGNSGKKFKSYSEEPKTRKCQGYWTFFPAFEGGLGYWLDASHPESLGIFDQAIQKQRFLERASLSVIRRLILAAHPAIATKTPVVTSREVDEKGNVVKAEGYIVVYGFAMDNDPKVRHAEIEAMAERVIKGTAQAEVVLPHHDAGTEDAEIADPILAGADPTELPPANGDDDTPPTVTIKPSVPPTPPVEKPAEPEFSPEPELTQAPSKPTKPPLKQRYFVSLCCGAIRVSYEKVEKCNLCTKQGAVTEANSDAGAEEAAKAVRDRLKKASQPLAPQTPPSNGGDQKARFMKLLNNREEQHHVARVMSKLEYQTFGEIRANPEKLATFFAEFDKGEEKS